MTPSTLPENGSTPRSRQLARTILSWVDCSTLPAADPNDPKIDRVDWLRTLPFVLLHVDRRRTLDHLVPIYLVG